MRSTHLIAVALLTTATAHAAFEIKSTDGKVEILEDGKPLTAYYAARSPYVYPLPSASGANLARNWPIKKGVEGEQTDHPHHTSLWLSHGAVNGHDFWSWHGKGNPEIRHTGTSDTESGEKHAAFTVDLEWVADGKTQLTEKRRYRFERTDPKTLTIEVDSQLTAEGADAVFGDTKEGTFAVRVDRTLRLKGSLAKGGISDSEGRKDGKTWGKRSKWVAFHGPDEKGEPAVVAMFDHKDNLRHPTWWHARDYGLLAANPFGIHDFEGKKDRKLGEYVLKKGETLRLRYLVVLHHGTVESAGLPERWSAFNP
ncbi:oxidoreductase [Haloferula helveola]|uniref:Oxidoreductase n=1 Tax=Haloferula helveola TaxID=490095 RepID=A0ABM7R936_9BACT|nr:oxidoreductase [Haloferula helveola]